MSGEIERQAVAGAKFFFKVEERDLISELLRDKRSEATRRAYQRDLTDFFTTTTGSSPSAAMVAEFLGLPRATAIGLVLQYKAGLIERKLAEATVNRRLAALRSLATFAQKIGRCEWSLEEISGERLQAYRDTSGVDEQAYSKILDQCDRSTIQGRRNYAILLLLWSNVLRRGELTKTNIGDFNAASRQLRIYGKGRGTQSEFVSLPPATSEAIAKCLEDREALSPDMPLFVSLSNRGGGKRLQGNDIYNLVVEAAAAAGIDKHLSPHRIRHGGITAALDATGGDVRRVQKLSRHKRIDTLLIYDDHRQNSQAEISDLLSGLVDNSGIPEL